MAKNSWKIKSKNYFARIRIKKNDKDGEYFDIFFGLIGQEPHAHFGIRVASENGLIGGKVFFIKSRNVTSNYREQTFNQKTGELISELEMPFEEEKTKVGAQIHYRVEYNENEKKCYITNFKIIETDET